MDLAGDLSKLALALAPMVASQGDPELCVSTKRTGRSLLQPSRADVAAFSGGRNFVPVGAVIEGGREGSWDRA